MKTGGSEVLESEDTLRIACNREHVTGNRKLNLGF
jgi:hypothetical protein